MFGLYTLEGVLVSITAYTPTFLNYVVISLFLQASSSKEYGDMLREFKTTLAKVIEKNENKRIESHLE